MNYFITVLLALFGLSGFAHAENSLPTSFATTYKQLVDGDGNISVPASFQSSWVFLGTWSVATRDAQQGGLTSGGAGSLHNVYTQPDVIEYYQKHRAFPDGAVLIKELFKGVTAPMTTGIVSRVGELEGWFVMVKDTQNRFPMKKHWGDGWGWALIKTDSGENSITKDYKSECLGCHLPAKSTDWIYTDGYPLLRTNH